MAELRLLQGRPAKIGCLECALKKLKRPSVARSVRELVHAARRGKPQPPIELDSVLAAKNSGTLSGADTQA
jgi:hypothetical protein